MAQAHLTLAGSRAPSTIAWVSSASSKANGVELIRGMVVKMSPIGPPHASVIDRLNRLLVRALGEQALVHIQQPFLAFDEFEPEPDVAIVPEASYTERHPDTAHLIIEVAKASLDYDRDTKGTEALRPK